MTMQMKATVQYFPVVPRFITQYKEVLVFEFVDQILSVTIQMKAFEHYFLVVFFTMLRKVVQTFYSEGEIIMFDHSNESY